MANWTSEQITDQRGRVALVTGANSGLGLEVARALARKGASVVMACRNTGKGEEARRQLLAEQPQADLRVVTLDTASLASVAACATQLLAELPRLDLLINNAGIMATPHAHSVDGFEMQLATNHLGHFALTGRLLPKLLAAPGSRIVAVSSTAAQMGKIDFDDLMGGKRYDPWKAYGQSKLANLMFALELQRRLSAQGATTQALAAHPGASTTGLFSTPGGGFVKRVLTPLLGFLFQSASQGAWPLLYAATAAEAQPGGYYGPNGFKEMKGFPAPALIVKQARDLAVARRLWEVSEELVGVKYL